MTDLLERPVVVCAAAKHGATRRAWGDGCRCAPAIAANEQWKARGKRRNAPAALVDGECVAERHGTINAYLTAGCRHPLAVDKYRAKLERSRRANRRKRPAVDPRARWRGPAMRVNAVNLGLLVQGFSDKPTTAEYLVAVMILDGRGNRWGTGMNTISDVARTLHIKTDTVRKYRKLRADLRASRTARRLADAQWRAAR